MNTVSYQLHGKPHTISAPSSWNEVSLSQLSAWITVLNANLPESEKLKLAVPIFYSLKSAHYKLIPDHYLIQFAPTLRFIFAESALTNWLLPKVRIGLQTFHGPADALSNLTAAEFFMYAEKLYWQYNAKPAADTLNALIAVLYREKRTGVVSNDLRCQLTDAGVAHRAKLMAKLPEVTRLAILFNYEGCRNFITGTHRKIFSGKGGQSKKRNDVTLALAGGPLGDLEKTRNTNLYDFLLHLEQLIEQEEKLREPS